MSLAARTGALFGLFDKPTYFSDRFQLGGPASIRMFRQNSMGPRDGRASYLSFFVLFHPPANASPVQSTPWVVTCTGRQG